MNTQPEALRLVEWLDLGSDPYDKAAAAELRRLHEVNQELVEVAEMVAEIGIHTLPDRPKCRCTQCDMVNLAKAALAKAKGGQND